MTMADVHMLGVLNVAELLTGSADLCIGDLECTPVAEFSSGSS